MSAQHRRRVALNWVPRFESASARVIRAESRAVMQAVRTRLVEQQRSAEDFAQWLNEFYETFPDQVAQRFSGVVRAFAETQGKIAADEVDTEFKRDAAEAFARNYERRFGRQWAGSSKAQLQDLLQRENPAEEIERRTRRWEEKRPRKASMRASITISGGVALGVFLGAGLLYGRWMAFGKNCPYCDSLDGKKVLLGSSFLEIGNFQPPGAERPIKITGLRRHPPIHGQCDCALST